MTKDSAQGLFVAVFLLEKLSNNVYHRYKSDIMAHYVLVVLTEVQLDLVNYYKAKASP